MLEMLDILEKISLKINEVYFTLIDYKVTKEYALHTIDKKLYKSVYEETIKDLGIDEIPYNFVNLGVYTRGTFDKKNQKISINSLMSPTYYFLAGGNEENNEQKIKNYKIALNQLSSISHELRHAWQSTKDEYQIYFDNYITYDKDLNEYKEQYIEVDARQYQSQFFNNNKIYKSMLNELNNIVEGL